MILNLVLLRACLKTRPVVGPGLQETEILAVFCRPRALTRRWVGVFKQPLRNRGWCPGGVVESRQLQFVRPPFPSASQSVALSSSDFWDDRPKADWHPKRWKFRPFPRTSAFFRLIPGNPRRWQFADGGEERMAMQWAHLHTATVWSPAFTRFLVSRAMDCLKAVLQTSTLVVEVAVSCAPMHHPQNVWLAGN